MSDTTGFTQVDFPESPISWTFVNGVSIFRVNANAPPTLIAGARPTPATSGITSRCALKLPGPVVGRRSFCRPLLRAQRHPHGPRSGDAPRLR